MNPRCILGTLLLGACFALPLAAPRVHAAPGDVDSYVFASLVAERKYAAVAQPDGKIILAGEITLGFRRFTTSGTADSFTPSFLTTAPNTGHCVTVQPSGKILLGGDFSAYNGTKPAGGFAGGGGNFARVNADGSVDLTWTASYFTGGLVRCMAEQADGRILVGGHFTEPNNRIARVEADGVVDANFSPQLNVGVTPVIKCMAVQADGRILIAGVFSTVNGVPRQSIARLEADGSLDLGFECNPSGAIECMAVQADGKILIAGRLSAVGGIARQSIARLETNGALDLSFDPNVSYPSVDSITSMALQANGRIVIAGNFTAVDGVTRNRVARLEATGALDPGFDPNANYQVFGVSLQADGKVLLTGDFLTLQPNGAAASTTRYGAARLLNDSATQTLSVLDTAHIRWTRGGSTPELSRATFELSTDGGTTWGAPIAATRIGTTSNWGVSNGSISLPASGRIRARGVTTGVGYRNGSSVLIEQVLNYSGITQTAPEIVVTSNGVNIFDGDNTPNVADPTNFGPVALGTTTVVRTFTIANTGSAALNLTGTPPVVVSGSNAADFAVTQQPAFPLAATTGTTTFQITFTPGAEGVRNATISIASNDADEATFDFAVTGRALSTTTDTDGDGLNDSAELLGAALGLDWQVSQPALVQSYNGMASSAGLYSAAQVQALHIGTPLISRDGTTGKFKLTLALGKTTTLSPLNWQPFPFVPAGTAINGKGEVEFEFTTPDNAAFYRLEAR